MALKNQPTILIVGAGAIGIMLGYHLSLAGADLTYLVRPHHAQRLSRPQILYSYHDKTSIEFKGYSFVTEPAQIGHSDYDYVLITPDAATLMAPLGAALVKTIGEVFKGEHAKIILAGTFHNFKNWFAATSGLPEDRLACIIVPIAIHETKTKLKTHGYVDMEQFDKADYAYARLNPDITLQIEDVPAFADFVSLYNTCGVGRCVTAPAAQMAAHLLPIFALLIPLELLGWPSMKDLDRNSDLWRLGIAAVKELRGLSLYGEAGRQAVDATNEDSLVKDFSAMEQTALPLDQADFNRYHHGGKVSKQDQDHVRACIEYAEADGKPLTAAPELLRRLEEKLGRSA
ncbi:uncharacterized protein N7500_006684 [Penicillium coprophilum]|uniref:uncharacterized protein n=1 Tax=Penicillium coprophilum TaxID=36646 RepID=UPI00238B8DB5|nr:uncharacterized protein N7500_006684 [Penicillium coprophilum]KAJ5164854.1 hypothetical protein N7500_006684 [Penicillium coprophilum]